MSAKVLFSALVVVGLTACSPPLAATPAAAPQPTTAPAAAAAKPTTVPGAPGVPAPTTAPAAQSSNSALDAATGKYYEAAKKEGKLVLYGVGNATLYNPIRDAFMKRFPGIELQGVDQRGRESR